jgi:cold shock CspA family protein
LFRAGCAVRVGDVVTGRIKRYKPTGRRSWTSVRLSVPVPTGRVRGIVTVCKDSYGFLRLETVSAPDAELANPAEDIWFPFSELIDRHRKVRIGDELSFNVEVGSKGKSAAARLAFLPKGSIPVSESSSSSTSLSGVVVEEIRRTFNRSGKKPHGLIEAGSATYEFRLDDLVNKKVVLKVGDLVDFKATGSSVNAVKLRPRVGFVESIVDAEINVRALPDVVGAECTVADLVARASRWELFPFSTQSTEKTEKTGDSTVADVTASLDAVQLSAFVVDQLVEFDIGASRRHNSTGGERAALSLRQASSDVTQKYLALAALLPEVRVARQAAVDENKSSIDLRKSMTAEKRKATLQVIFGNVFLFFS